MTPSVKDVLTPAGTIARRSAIGCSSAVHGRYMNRYMNRHIFEEPH